MSDIDSATFLATAMMLNDNLRMQQEQQFRDMNCITSSSSLEAEHRGSYIPKYIDRNGGSSEVISDSVDEGLKGFGKIVTKVENGKLKSSSISATVNDGRFIIIFDYKNKLISKHDAIKMIQQGFEIAQKLGYSQKDCIIVDNDWNELNKESLLSRK